MNNKTKVVLTSALVLVVLSVIIFLAVLPIYIKNVNEAATAKSTRIKVGELNVASGDIIFKANGSIKNSDGTDYCKNCNYWAGAKTVCESAGMRLPNYEELGSIIDYSKRHENNLKFQHGYYWSSKEQSTYNAWYMPFPEGISGYGGKGPGLTKARCVE